MNYFFSPDIWMKKKNGPLYISKKQPELNELRQIALLK